MISASSFVKALTAAKPGALLHPFVEFLCLDGVKLRASSPAELVPLFAEAVSDSQFSLANEEFSSDRDCKKFFEHAYEYMEPLEAAVNGLSVELLMRALGSLERFQASFKDVRQRILRCVGAAVLLSVLGAAEENLLIQMKARNEQLKEAGDLLWEVAMPRALHCLAEDPFSEIQKAALTFLVERPKGQQRSYGQMVPVFSMLQNASPAIRLAACKVLQTHADGATLLTDADKINGGLLDVSAAVQVELIKLLGKNFSVDQAIRHFSNIAWCCCCNQKQIRTTVFKTFSFSAFNIVEMFYKCKLSPEQQEYILFEQLANLKHIGPQQVAELCEKQWGPVEAEVIVSLINKVAPANVASLRGLVRQFPSLTQRLVSFDGLQDDIRATEYAYLLDSSEEAALQLLEQGRYDQLLSQIPKLYPPREQMMFFIQSSFAPLASPESTLQALRLRLCFLLRLKEASSAEFHTCSAFSSCLETANDWITQLHSSLDFTGQQQPFDNDQLGRISAVAEISLGMAEIAGTFLRAFPRSCSERTDIGRRAISAFLRAFGAAFDLKYCCYENGDKNEDTADKYLELIELLDSKERALVELLSHAPAVQLMAAWLDIPVTKKIAAAALDRLGPQEICQAATDALNLLDPVAEMRLKGCDLREEAADFLVVYLKSKATPEMRKVWAALAAWGNKHGVAGLVKGINLGKGKANAGDGEGSGSSDE